MDKRAGLMAGIVVSLLILASILATSHAISPGAASASPAPATPRSASDNLLPVTSLRNAADRAPTPVADSAAAASTDPAGQLSAPAAPSCSSPQWDLDSGGGVNLHCWNNVYVVSVDLRNPEVEVRPAEVYRPNPLSSVADGDTIAVINGDYTDYGCSGTRCGQGLFYVAGEDKTNRDKLCRDALKRRVLALSSDGRPLIDWWYGLVDNPQAVCANLVEGGGWVTGYRYHVIGGGPQITFDGSFRWDCAYGRSGNGDCYSNGWEVVINEEHFGTSATNWWNRNQTVVGYTTDGNRLLLAVTNGAVNPQGVHDVLWQVAQHHGQTLKAAIKYDGGSVSGLYYRRNPTYSINPNVPVANAWLVRRRAAPPTQTPPPSPSCHPNADQAALYADTDYRGSCVTLNVGEYPNPGYLSPLGNDNAEAVRVGADVQAVLCEHDNYQGVCETFATDDPNLSDNAIGANRVSSVKVQRRQPTSTPTSPWPTATPTPRPPTPTPTPPPGCHPGPNGIVLYEHTYWMGSCYTFTADHPDFNLIGFNDVASSLRFVGSYVDQYQVTLYEHTSYGGRAYTFHGDHPDFNTINFNDMASSLTVRRAASRRTYLPAVNRALPPADGLRNGDFEQGRDAGWQEYSTHGWPIIVHADQLPVAPYSGRWATWLGGDNEEISAIWQSATVPATNAALSFWYWIASEDGCGYDFGGVVINGSSVVDVFDLCTDANTHGWRQRTVNLQSYAGQSVEIQIRAETDSSLNSNLFVDDVALGTSSAFQQPGERHEQSASGSTADKRTRFPAGPAFIADERGREFHAIWGSLVPKER